MLLHPPWHAVPTLFGQPHVVELLDPFIPGLKQQNVEIISPAGAPGVIMFLSKRTGQAEINVVTGDPWYYPTCN